MKYRKIPVEIEAIQYTGSNLSQICEFVGLKHLNHIIDNDEFKLVIPTLEGDMKASRNDFIIKGIQGEFYPCKPNIFEKTYEQII